MTSELWVHCMGDIEPDMEIYGGAPMTHRKGLQSWKGITEGLVPFLEYCDSVRDDDGLPLRLTLFVRSDLQIAEFCGRHGWMLHHFWPLWDKFMEKGHIIGWHAHIWRWSDKKGSWYQEMFDERWIKEECLTPGYEDIKSYLQVNISRMGWCYHNNFTISLLNQLGIVADFTAVSDYVIGIKKGRPTRDYCMFDWSSTPNYPYHPSEVDYRRESRNGEKSLSIIEVPQTTLRLGPILYTMRLLKSMVQIKKCHSHMLINMYSSPLFLVRKFIRQHLRRSKQEVNPVILSWSFHADDLLPDTNLKIILSNIYCLLQEARQSGIKLKFKTASQIINNLANKNSF